MAPFRIFLTGVIHLLLAHLSQRGAHYHTRSLATSPVPAILFTHTRQDAWKDWASEASCARGQLV